MCERSSDGGSLCYSSTTWNYFNNDRETGSGNSEAESGCAVGSCPNSALMLTRINPAASGRSQSCSVAVSSGKWMTCLLGFHSPTSYRTEIFPFRLNVIQNDLSRVSLPFKSNKSPLNAVQIRGNCSGCFHELPRALEWS